MTKKITLLSLLSVIIFFILSAFSYTKICCMFAATRYFGWPYPYLNLTKTVETLDEAKLVESANIFTLQAAGWEFHFGGDFLHSTIFGALGNVLLTIALSIVSAILIYSTSKTLHEKLVQKK